MGVSGDQTLSLRDYVSLDPLPGSDAVGSGSDDAAEVFGMEVKEGSVVLYLFGIAVMRNDKVAEAREDLRVIIRGLFAVLLLSIVIDELVSDDHLRQENVISVFEFESGMGCNVSARCSTIWQRRCAWMSESEQTGAALNLA